MLCMLSLYFNALSFCVISRVENLRDIILIMCSSFFIKLFALFVNVQYFSVVLHMFNIYTGVQMSFVDR